MSALEGGGEIGNALRVESTFEVDWETLGMVVAERPSPDQAQFLLGFVDGLDVMQPAWIAAEPLDAADRARVAGALRVLADHIEDPS